MIISHRHRFIFIKTTKTAGTSIEVWLSGLCGEHDIVTPFGKPEPGHQPRNCEGFYNHMPAAEIRTRVGEMVWSSYYKFCFERNPWDKVVSYYFFKRKRYNLPQLTLAQLVDSDDLPIDHPKYLIDNALAVDRIGRYETLQDDLAQIGKHLGLAAEPALTRAKGAYRDTNSPYRRLFEDARLQNSVAERFNWEITNLGYQF